MRVPDSPQNEATRQALLAAAAPIFARDGFSIARIREIAAAAGVNLSAINYHFGSKQGLYEAVLAHVAREVIERYPLPVPGRSPEDPEAQFRALVTSLLRRFVDTEQPSLVAQFLVREMANPTPALDRLIEQVGKPQLGIVSTVIARLLGPGASENTVRDCTLSVMGQVVFYLFGRPLVTRLFPTTYRESRLQALAQHIADFSLAGIRQYRDQFGRGR